MKIDSIGQPILAGGICAFGTRTTGMIEIGRVRDENYLPHWIKVDIIRHEDDEVILNKTVHMNTVVMLTEDQISQLALSVLAYKSTT